MLDALRFVVGSVAKKDFVPELTHFKIKNGWIQGFNGQMSSACRIDLDLTVMPWATEMVNAVRACTGDTVAMNVTPSGRLSVRSGKFKCFVDCLDPSDEALQTFPQPEGEFLQVGDSFMKMLDALAPFMAEDASRPWAMGIMLDKNTSFATNNVMLAQYWHGIPFPFRCTLPAEAVREIMKIKEHPTAIQLSKNSMTVWFGQDRWIRSQLLEDAFPDTIEKVFEQFSSQMTPIERYDGFFDAIDRIKPFLGDLNTVVFQDNALATSETDEDGASFEVPNIFPGPLFNHKHLSLLRESGIAFVDFTGYPGACSFAGPMLRGIFMGVKRASNA